MNKQFTKPQYFEIQYNAQMHQPNIVWLEGGRRKGFHIQNLEVNVPTRAAYFDHHPRFRMVGECKSIITKGDKTVIE